MNDNWSKMAVIEAIQNTQTQSIDKLSDICNQLARTLGDVNTTQLLTKQLLERVQDEARDQKKATVEIELKVLSLESWRQKLSGSWLTIGALVTGACSVCGLILLAIQTMKIH